MKRKSGVIINPSAGRGNGKGLKLAAELAKTPQVDVRLLKAFDQLHNYLRNFAEEGVTDLYLSSGDGTVQAVQTFLAETDHFKARPRLCLLPHGSTNLTGTDVGFRDTSIASQANYIAGTSEPKLQKRHSLRVANAGNGQVIHGMTLGAGAAARGTRRAQRAYNDRGIKGAFANFAIITGALAQAAFSKSDPDDETRVDRPCVMEIRRNGNLITSGPQLMFFATTLHQLFFRTRPFWGGKNGPIRASVFPYPPPNILRWALPLMYGGEDRAAPEGAFSFSGAGFEIASEESFVMDGEFFDGPKSGLLQVTAGPEFEFIVG